MRGIRRSAASAGRRLARTDRGPRRQGGSGWRRRRAAGSGRSMPTVPFRRRRDRGWPAARGIADRVRRKGWRAAVLPVPRAAPANGNWRRSPGTRPGAPGSGKASADSSPRPDRTKPFPAFSARQAGQTRPPRPAHPHQMHANSQPPGKPAVRRGLPGVFRPGRRERRAAASRTGSRAGRPGPMSVAPGSGDPGPSAARARGRSDRPQPKPL